MTKKIALIFGITGQDGSHLADLLIKKKYKVIGVKRRSSSFNTKRIDHLLFKDNVIKPNNNFELLYGDLTDSSNILRIIRSTKPDEIYNLGAQSHVRTSFDIPEFTANVDAIGSLRILEAIRILNLEKKTKYYQASTSEIFGNTYIPQNEKTPFRPRSPYAIAKLYAYWTTVNFREAYDIFAVNGILFNHEGPRRGENFVSKKITKSVAEIHRGKRKFFSLGNLNAKRDWGSAKDYVESMWLMLQSKKASDYVIATGKSYSVKQFVEEAFKFINIKIGWRGKDLKEIGFNKKDGRILVKVDPIYFRPTEINELRGDSKKAKSQLRWKPKTSFKQLVKEMMMFDLKEIK
jgi:GDPmannose 4,6-dehydratase